MPKELNLRAWGAPAAILLAALLAFGLTLKTGFMWDDHRMIEENPRLHFSAANLASAFKGDPFSQGLNYYRPLQTVSNMADFAVWGYRPFGYHLTNLFFHAATAVLFFYLALALGFGRPAALWASILLAAAGFKENGVVTPALAALCLWYQGRGKKDYLKLLPFFAFIPVYLFLRHQALGMDALAKGLGPVLSGLFLKVPGSVLIYLKEAVLPFDMHSHRMQPDGALLLWAGPPALAAAAFLIARKGGRAAVFCAGWYLLNLAPKLPLLATNDLMLDHWVYLANAGLFLWAADRLHIFRKLFPALALALIMASAVNITRRNTDLKIYENAARTSTSKPMLYNLAREYYLLGRAAESRAILEKISAADPGNAMYLNGLALARWRTGEIPGALAALEQAQAAKPGSAETLFNKYCVLAAAGKNREAMEALNASLAAEPDYAPALLTLGRVYAAAGRTAEAGAAYARLLKAYPDNLEALNDYGILLARSGDYAGAGGLFRRALKVSPGLQSARQNLARLETLTKK